MSSKHPHLASSPTLQDSIKKFEQELKLERHITVIGEKQVLVKRQLEEITRLMQTQVGDLHRWTESQPARAEGMAWKRAGGLREGRFLPPVFSRVRLYSLHLCISLSPSLLIYLYSCLGLSYSLSLILFLFVSLSTACFGFGIRVFLCLSQPLCLSVLSPRLSITLCNTSLPLETLSFFIQPLKLQSVPVSFSFSLLLPLILSF